MGPTLLYRLRNPIKRINHRLRCCRSYKAVACLSFRQTDIPLVFCLSISLNIKKNMGFSVNTRGFFLFSCIALLVFQSETVSAIRGIDLALKWDKGSFPFVEHSRILEAVDSMDSLQTRPSLAPAPSTMFDLNQSNKRSVDKGSDPIHNRC
ncbi:hypothetical protein HRI_003669400 [Hibiscus trionum]|uniref:Uncharacterized protein n=1 Tax=Hibiscus trionum TaxID=183268 RepID=A0A9W7IRV0_HIBTR|nr:hypothetical protein HRI_003669400 [Hibiscus trionum]